MSTDILKQLRAMWDPPRLNPADAMPTAPQAVTAVANAIAVAPAILPTAPPKTKPADQAVTPSCIDIQIECDITLEGKKAAVDKSLRSPLKYHGGKTHQAERIVDLMPPHIHYVEPYCGGLSVLWAKNPIGVSEVVNDMNGQLINLFVTMQSEGQFPKFLRRVQATPFSESLFEAARNRLDSGMTPTNDDEMVQMAVDFFIVNRQSYSGRMEGFTVLSKTRTRRDMNEQASAWLGAIEGLPEIHRRLMRVVILSRPALEVIKSQDSPKTLFYLDPPYLLETRASTGQYGSYEMTDADHSELLALVRTVQGKVMLSGYPNDMYDRALAEWNRHEYEQAKHSSGSKTKSRATEVIWMNF